MLLRPRRALANQTSRSLGSAFYLSIKAGTKVLSRQPPAPASTARYKVVSSRKGASGRGRTGRSEAHRKDDPGTVVDIDCDWKPTVRGRIERTAGGARISTDSGEKAERLRQRLPKQQLAAEGLQIQGEEINRDQFNEVEVNMKIDGVVWLRAAAKMAVASLSRSVDGAWLDADDAKQLRSWMWDEEPIFVGGSPAFAYPREARRPETLMAPPPTRLITMIATPISGRRVVVSMGLLCRFLARVGVEVPPPLPDRCWVDRARRPAARADVAVVHRRGD